MGNQQASFDYTLTTTNLETEDYSGMDSGYYDESNSSSTNNSFESKNFIDSIKEPADITNTLPNKINAYDDVFKTPRSVQMIKSKSIGIGIGIKNSNRNLRNGLITKENDLFDNENDDQDVDVDVNNNSDNINKNNNDTDDLDSNLDTYSTSKKFSILNNKYGDNFIIKNNNNPSIYSSSWSPNSYIQKAKESTIKSSQTAKIIKSKSTSNKSSEDLKSTKQNTPVESVAATVANSSPIQSSFLRGMNFVGRVAKGFKEFYNEINPATLTGAIDVIVVKQEDESFKCSPFHVRFGKLGVIRAKEKIVDIEINGQSVPDLHMELGDAGEAYFMERIPSSDEEDDVNDEVALNDDEQDLNNKEKIINNENDNNLKLDDELANINKNETSRRNSKIINKSEQINSFITFNNDNNSNLNSDDPEEKSIKNIIKDNQNDDKSIKLTNEAIITSSGEYESASEIVEKEKSEQDNHKLTFTSTEPVAVKIDDSNTTKITAIAEATIEVAEAAAAAAAATSSTIFFSDGEITPELTSPAVSRPPTPKSDTELDMHKTKRQQSISKSRTGSENQWSWSWGQLPERNQSLTSSSFNTKQPTATPAVLIPNVKSSINNNNNSITNKSGEIGIYLDETEKLDSEVAALYLDQKSNSTFNKSKQQLQQQQVQQASLIAASNKDDDQESGRGQSPLQPFPQSPLPRCDLYSLIGDVQISLCGVYPATSAALNISPNTNNLAIQQSPIQASSTIQQQPITKSTSSSSINIHASIDQQQQQQQQQQQILFSYSPPINNNLSMSPPTSAPLFSASIDNQSSQLLLIDSASSAGLNYEDLFQQYSVPFERFIDEMQTLTSNPNLIFKINNRYMSWQTAAPVILSAIVYHRQLPNECLNTLLGNDLSRARQQDKQLQQNKPAQQQPPPTTAGGWGKNLLFWSKKPSSTVANNPSTTPTITNTNPANTTTTTTTLVTTTTTLTTTTTSTTAIKPPCNKNDENFVGIGLLDEDLLGNVVATTSNNVTPTNGPLQQMAEGPLQTNMQASPSSTAITTNKITKSPSSNNNNKMLKSASINILKSRDPGKYRKTTRLSSDLIKKLNLKPGPNEIKYSVTTALQGTTRIDSYVFLWNYDDKVIISDIDGTITKSDVWGQVLPIFGRDWSQAGVADLFTAIERNEYRFIYLSARAIGQSKLTRDLLRNIKQDGFTLPEGPLLVTPTSLFTAFQKEVIERKPEEFKISCLKDIQTLFPYTPCYYAGYGNKSTDVTAYKAVGIPTSRIFTINPQGELKHEVSRSFQSSYSKLCDYVDLIFPPFKPSSVLVKSEYQSFGYWRDTANLLFLEEIEQELNESNSVSPNNTSTSSSNNEKNNLNANINSTDNTSNSTKDNGKQFLISGNLNTSSKNNSTSNNSSKKLVKSQSNLIEVKKSNEP